MCAGVPAGLAVYSEYGWFYQMIFLMLLRVHRTCMQVRFYSHKNRDYRMPEKKNLHKTF